jgi:hypothetical protein
MNFNIEVFIIVKLESLIENQTDHNKKPHRRRELSPKNIILG